MASERIGGVSTDRSGPTQPDPTEHYETLANRYDLLWEHSTEFQSWMCEQILDAASLPAGPAIADVGGGTGIYAKGLLARLDSAARIYVVDPSAEMLSMVTPSPSLVCIQGTAAEATGALNAIGVSEVDLVLITEAVHHFADINDDLRSLLGLVETGGSMLVVMLPKSITYPLFDKALRRFEDWQPDPRHVEQLLASYGLTTKRSVRSFQLTMTSQRWLEMVEGRFMSLLSSFSDDELAVGIDEIREQLGDATTVTFPDTFEFISAHTR